MLAGLAIGGGSWFVWGCNDEYSSLIGALPYLPIVVTFCLVLAHFATGRSHFLFGATRDGSKNQCRFRARTDIDFGSEAPQIGPRVRRVLVTSEEQASTSKQGKHTRTGKHTRASKHKRASKHTREHKTKHSSFFKKGGRRPQAAGASNIRATS